MIISEQWLRDWVGLDLTAQQIADCLTNAGLEVDGVELLAQPIDGVLVGQVQSITKHPDADRLKLTKVDIGTEVLDIVCGASNVREGMLVPVATLGTKLPGGLKIKKAKVRGIESYGMLCSAAELGIAESADGLLELDGDAELGQRVDEYLQLDDVLIDIDLTPNRGDCLSVQGIARELKVLADAEYHPVVVGDVAVSSNQNIDVVVDDAEACPRYLARVVEGIDSKQKTPLWMVEKLRRSGVRAINPIVDITNFVMLEMGQPMHAFDLSKIDQSIIVRQSQAGEKITLLDDSSQALDNDTLVIADAKGPIAIAGVMGGAHSAIDDTTSNIILESAHFTRSAISGRARRYGLHTDSSYRFERGVDPQLPALAMQRATELILAICGGDAGPITEKGPVAKSEKPTVTLRLDRLQRLLGMPLKFSEVGDILRRVSDEVKEDESGWTVVPPSYRFDIERECDLVEEVARVTGYDNIPTTMPSLTPTSVGASEKKIEVANLKHALVMRDYQEVINYSFVDPEVLALFDDQAPIKLSNPLAENMSVMRTTLLPGLLQSLQFNQNRQQQRIRLFEVGSIYNRQGDNYKERPMLAGIVTGSAKPIQWGVDNSQKLDFYDVKSDLEALLSLTGCKEPFIFKELEHIALHPGQSASIIKGDVDYGWIGRLHPSLEKKYGSQAAIYVFELDLHNLQQAKLPEYEGISRFPSVKRDLSITVDESILVADIVQTLKGELGNTLVNVVLFDVYRGDGIAENSKSISFSLSLQHKDKTLTDEESEKIVGDALYLLENKFSAKLRS